MIDQQATKAAKKIVSEAAHNMNLENQGIPDEQTKNQIEKLAFELKQKMDPRIWRGS